MSKINMFKMEVCTLWSELECRYAIYILPNCIRHSQTEFAIDRTIITCLNSRKELTVLYGRAD